MKVDINISYFTFLSIKHFTSVAILQETSQVQLALLLAVPINSEQQPYLLD